jgi:hypothetical protein
MQIIYNLFSKKYKQFSNYLNMKYNIINDITKNRKIYKKKISLYSVYLFDLLATIINPDYLIYIIFGDNHLNQNNKNSVKIEIFTEDKIPDLNEVQYSIGQAHIN